MRPSLPITALLACSLYLTSLGACSQPKPATDEQWLRQNTLDNLVFVEGGSFTMGDVGYIDENGQRQRFTGSSSSYLLRDITLSSYSMLKYEITFKEFDMFTKVMNRLRHKDKMRDAVLHMGPEYPVKHVTWQQARDYCEWAGKLIGYPMDLATEAQWEYAARSRGLPVPYATDNGQYEPGRNLTDRVVTQWSMPVGSWPPNPLGLYDMTGNIAEWVLDWHAYYLKDDLIDPKGPDADYVEKYFVSDKVVRGGGSLEGKNFRILYRRIKYSPDIGSGKGIRCVANHPKPITAAKTK